MRTKYRVQAWLLAAAAFAATGEVCLAGGDGGGFAIRLVPMAETPPFAVRVDVHLPHGRRLDHLAADLDGESLGILERPPFILQIPPLAAGDPGVLRVRGLLEGGGEIEDAVVLGRSGSRLEVRGVDLWVDIAAANLALGSARLAVYENDIEQTIDSIVPAGTLPLELGVLLDASPTMHGGGAMEAALVGVERWMETLLRPGDHAALWAFHDSVEELVPFTADMGDLRSGLLTARLRAARPSSSGTAVRDCLLEAIDRMAARKLAGGARRHAVLLVTDGRDSASTATVADLQARALRADVRLYVLMVGMRQLGTELPRAAKITGGRAFRVRTADAVPAVLHAIGRDLAKQYILSYRSSLAGETSCRRLRLTAESAGRQLAVRSISGYCP